MKYQIQGKLIYKWKKGPATGGIEEWGIIELNEDQLYIQGFKKSDLENYSERR